ncbi:hypothetical protein FF1_014807 [Malus domestica]
MLPVVSCFRQVNAFLVIEMIGQNESEGTWVLFFEVLGLQCIIEVYTDEDHGSSILSFVNRVFSRFLDGSSKTLCGKMELQVSNPL